MHLGLSRTRLTTGQITEEEFEEHRATMEAISQYVRFVALPFDRDGADQGSRERYRGAANMRNLDVVQAIASDIGCDIFIADLWQRCLVDLGVEQELRALYRQQAMAEELRCHFILVHQINLKQMGQRADKRPTPDSLKGTGGYYEIANTVLATHRPALFKAVPDDVLEIDVLKQRQGKSLLAIEFAWDADTGIISGGKDVPYEVSSEAASEGPIDGFVNKNGGGKWKGRR